jgi:hypothetical protein
LLRQARRQQGQGSSSRSNRRQQGPSTRKLYWPPGLGWILPASSSRAAGPPDRLAVLLARRPELATVPPLAGELEGGDAADKGSIGGLTKMASRGLRLPERGSSDQAHRGRGRGPPATSKPAEREHDPVVKSPAQGCWRWRATLRHKAFSQAYPQKKPPRGVAEFNDGSGECRAQ